MSNFGMKLVYRRPDGDEETFEIGPEEFGDLTVDVDALNSEPVRSVFEDAVQRRIMERSGERLENLTIYVDESVPGSFWIDPAESEADVAELPNATARRVSRYRALLQLANFVLPSSVRGDALDEWMDEIQSAAEDGLPFRRRALSILCRSLPALALRARLPVRARRGEG